MGKNTWQWKVLQALLGVAVLVSLAQSQRLTRAAPDREFLHVDNPIGYQSYALEPYVLNPSYTRRVPRYDRMGNFLTVGELAYSVDEARPGLSQFGGVARGLYAQQITLNYSVQRDSYKGTGYSLMLLTANPNLDARQLAEGVRTRFSPLTLNTTRFAGVRFDVHGLRNQSTFIYSRGAADRLRFSFFAPGRDERSPVILWGGHWQSSIGAALKIGTTFVNQHLTDTRVREGSIFRGNLPYQMLPPKRIYVRVTDDSPGDPETAAAVYSVAVVVHGSDADGTSRTLTNDPALAGEGVEVEADIQQRFVAGRRVGDHYEARGGDEIIEVEFTMPEDFAPHKAEFVASIAGDYRVGVRQVHDYIKEGSTTATESSWPATANPVHFERAFLTRFDPRYPTDFKFPEQDPVYTVLRAKGNQGDLFQPRTLRFTYGMPTAQTLASLDFAFEYQGYTMDGEMALNVQDFRFPAVGGERSNQDYIAYFLKGSGPVPFFPTRFCPQLGAEVFALPAAYSGGYDSKRGGAIFFTDVAPSPPGALTQEFNLYDDNDDGDQWPDEHPNDSAFSEINDAGVFPGMDEDGDNIIDTDRNANGRPDWTEPFLFFHTDPPEFIYDVDFNNNTLPDMTENDDEPDYPYRRGQRGFHGFVDFPALFRGLERLAFGLYRTEDPRAGLESVGRYVRLDARSTHSTWGYIAVADVLKWVEDDIPDASYIWQVSDDPAVNMLVVQSKERATEGALLDLVPPRPDPMLMRNSTANTLYIENLLTPLPGLAVKGRNKLVLNRRHDDELEDGSSQKSGTILRWTLSNRAEYTYPVRHNLVAGIRAKHLFRWDRGFGAAEQVRFSTLGPSADLSLQVSRRAQLVLGQEGWPLLPFHFTDLSESANNYRQRTTLALVRVDWDYWGWKMTVESGMQWQSRKTKAEKELGERTFFLEGYVGF